MKRILQFLMSLMALCLIEIHAFSQIPTNGVVGYYPFNGNAQDMSGNGNNGTVFNATLCPDRFGIANSAYDFNGTNAYIQLANPAQFNMAGTFTISLWCRINTTSSIQGTVFSKSNPSSWAANDKAFHHSIARNVVSDICAFGAPYTLATISNYQWYHLVWVYGITYSTVYINAVPQNMSYNWSNLPFPSDNSNSIVCIGKKGDGSYFNGEIDDIRFYNWALSQSNISALYGENPNQGTWVMKNSMPTPRTSCGSAVVNGKLYIIGGFLGTPNQDTQVVEEYDPSTDTWTTKAPMPTAREALGVAVVNNLIYCIGGSQLNSNRLTLNEVYNPQTNTWSTETSMPTGRTGLRCEAVSGSIYAIGGMTDWISPGTNIVEEFNPVTHVWTTKQPMLTATENFATSVYNNEIHVFGGMDASLNEVNLHQVYNATNNSWSLSVPMPTSRSAMGGATLFNKIYVVGGQVSYPSGITNISEVYDPSTNSWSTDAPMNISRMSHCLSNLLDKLYAVGGATGGYSTLSTNEQFTAPSSAPQITGQPQPQTVCKGGSASFTVVASGSGTLTYSWYKDGTYLPNGNGQPTYTVYNAQSTDVGNYYCIVSSSYGSVQSNYALLTVVVVTPPTIWGATVVPEWSVETYSVTQTSGSTYNFSVVNGNKLSNTANSITIQWGSTGWGQVLCTETNSMGCMSDPYVLNVAIGSVGIQEQTEIRIVLSPNPTTGRVNISSPEILENIVVYNSIGAKIFEKREDAQQIEIDLSQFGKGVYYLSISGTKWTVNRKIIVQ